MEQVPLLITHESPSMRQALAALILDVRPNFIVGTLSPEMLFHGFQPEPPPLLVTTYPTLTGTAPAVLHAVRGWLVPFVTPKLSLLGAGDQICPWPTADQTDLLRALDHLIAATRPTIPPLFLGKCDLWTTTTAR